MGAARLRNGEGSGGREAGEVAPGWRREPAAKGTAPAVHTVPTGRNSILFAPTWSEFEEDDGDFVDSASKYLPMRGYGAPVVWKDEQVTLAALETMGSGAYGVVRISTHGAPWPSEKDVQEVYIITGEEPTKLADSLHIHELESGELAFGAYGGGKRYFITADYLASRVDFAESKPLVLNAFCFGWLGGWPAKLRDLSKAGAVLGWDWEVVGRKSVAWDNDLLRSLCDTVSADPKTVQQWHAQMDPSYTEYELDGSESTVSLHHAAADSSALWNLGKITSITP